MKEDVPQVPQFGGRPFYGYDAADVQRSYTNRDAVQVADFLVPHLSEGKSVLDCGCGPGPITLGFAELVSPGRVVGIDIEPTMIDQANQLATDSGLENLEYQVADIYDLPFDDGEFDIVFSSAVTEHLSDPVRALREILRVTKPGGVGAVIRTDWSFPFIVPECPELSRFFELFEGGFNRIGGSLNRGRFLRVPDARGRVRRCRVRDQYVPPAGTGRRERVGRYIHRVDREHPTVPGVHRTGHHHRRGAKVDGQRHPRVGRAPRRLPVTRKGPRNRA